MTQDRPLSLSEIQRCLQDRKLTDVADATGSSYMSIQALRDGVERDYGINLLLKVSNYLREMSVREPA